MRWVRAGLLSMGLAVVSSFGLLGCTVSLDDDDEGTLSETGIDLVEGRYGHTATLLPDGTVLIVGGIRRTESGFKVRFPDDAEVYDPATESFSRVAESLELRRAFHAAVYMDNGTASTTDDFVLIAGGIDEIDDPDNPADSALGNVVRIDTGDGSFAITEIGFLAGRRMDLTGTRTADGRAVFIGGRDEDGDEKDDVQVWEPDLSATSDFEIGIARWNHRAAFYPNARSGWVVVTGGRDDDDVISQREVVDLEHLEVHAIGGGRQLQYHGLTFVDNNSPTSTDDALIEAGGLADVEEDIDSFQEDHLDEVTAFRLVDQTPIGSATSTAPTVEVVGATAFLPDPVVFLAATAPDGQQVVVTGGFESLFVDQGGFFTASFIDSDPSDRVARVLYDGSSLGVEVLARLSRARAMHTGTLLPDGTILVTGGINDDRNSVRGSEILSGF